MSTPTSQFALFLINDNFYLHSTLTFNNVKWQPNGHGEIPTEPINGYFPLQLYIDEDGLDFYHQQIEHPVFHLVELGALPFDEENKSIEVQVLNGSNTVLTEIVGRDEALEGIKPIPIGPFSNLNGG